MTSDEYCEHGIPWDEACADCTREYGESKRSFAEAYKRALERDRAAQRDELERRAADERKRAH